MPPPPPRPNHAIERYLHRPQSLASSAAVGPADPAEPRLTFEKTPPVAYRSQQSQASNIIDVVTVAVLDLKLQSLLQDLTHNIAREVGKIAHELRGEIDQLGEPTDPLKNKFDELTQNVHVLEEDNAAMRHTVSQLQLQQEDLENRETLGPKNPRGTQIYQ